HEVSGRADHDHAEEAEASELTEALKRASRTGKNTASAQQALRAQAERRRDLLKKLAKDNPGLVVDLALTSAERSKLPAPIRPLTEERVKIDGELRVRHIDREDGTSEYDIKLVGKGRETPLKLGRPIRGAKPGDFVKVDGVALAGDQTVVTEQIVTAQATTAAGPTGDQRTAIVLASAPGAAAHPYADKTNLASTFFAFGNPLSARNYYLEASYGQTALLGANGEGTAADIYGPYTLISSTCDTSTILSQVLAASDPDINFNQYDRLVISWNYSPCGNGGVGTVRVQTIGTYDGGTQRLSVSWNFNGAMGSTALNGRIGGVALHEYGHNLGVWHANSLECGTIPIGSDACNSPEYGDPADVMGNSGGFGHLNGVHKDILTWLGNGRSQTASGSG
ncbi:MAG: hypothetical protein IT307_21035, partial [Chloroflexi bacterium]|nr:hypothetical protein [Chloroflexota bacterium]